MKIKNVGVLDALSWFCGGHHTINSSTWPVSGFKVVRRLGGQEPNRGVERAINP
jgi:hypothetical protein